MILSLCSGYTGLDMAVTWLTGIETGWVSDVDPTACRILAHRLPDVPNLGDLTTIDYDALRGRASVITAGYPCQPFSKSGKRRGTEDPRHLFPHIARAVAAVGPRLVVLENVRGHLDLGFPEVLGTLADVGYDARWTVVPASAVGAPHGRERLFLVGTPTDANGLEERQEGPRRVAQPPREEPRPWAPRTDIPPRHGRPAHDDQGSNELPHWGEFAHAVRHWERVTGRPVPEPLAADGSLNPALPEWMMGLEPGWVTDVPGLSREQQRHALGNGVCPQQAAYALATMGLDRLEVAA